MIKPYLSFLKNSSFALDITIAAFMFPVAVALQNKLGFALNMGVLNFLFNVVDWNLFNFAPVLIWLLPAWYISLTLCKAYESFHEKYILETILRVINASVLICLFSLIIFSLIGFKAVNFNGLIVGYDLTYSIILIYPALSACVLIICRIILVALFRVVRTLGYNRRQVIIVGTGPRAISHFKKISEHPGWGLELVGFITLEKADHRPPELKEYPIIGTIENLRQILEFSPADEVFFIVPRKWLDRIEPAVMTCDTLGITVHIAIDLFSMKVSKTSLSYLSGLPVLSLNTTSTNYPALALKRSIDILGALIGLILFFPFALIIILLIKIESEGPVFFAQSRCSLNGRLFKMYKFRTMVKKAEQIKKDLLRDNELTGPVFKMKKDPRVTLFGKILRKFSIDEIPQLLNVLMGDMSLVGPRPPIPEEVRHYKPWQKRRLSMRPGLTCIWQVSGRNNIKFDKWMEMDLEYIDNWSLLLDLKILLKTIPCVIFAKGSY